MVIRIFVIMMLLAWFAGLSGCSCSSRSAPPEPEAPGLYVVGAEINEGIDGVSLLEFRVRLSPKRTDVVTVDYAAIDAASPESVAELIALREDLVALSASKIAQYIAVAGEDYRVKEAGSLTFAPGEQEKLLEFEIKGDVTYEKNELLGVRISNAVNADIIRGVGIGVIVNDDDLPIARMGVSETAETTLTEEYAAKTYFDIWLEGDSAVDAVVKLLVSGSVDVLTHADVIGDFRITDEQGNVYGKEGIITIPGLTTSMQFTIEIIDDGYAEDAERINMSITGLEDVIVHQSVNSVDVDIRSSDAIDFAKVVPLNDSGVANSVITGLDPSLDSFLDYRNGRDADDAGLNKIGNGLRGFDFTKLDENGDDLLETAGLWSCVRDNHTGLVWEVKHAGDEGIRSSSQNFHWYEPDPKRNGGVDFSSNRVTAGTIGSLDCGSADPEKSGKVCDTQFFVAEMNRTKMCGLTGWRLPEIKELRSIAVYQRPGDEVDNSFVDVNYFPFLSVGDFYLSATTVHDASRDGSSVWTMRFLNGISEKVELKVVGAAAFQAARLVNGPGL